VRPATPWVSKVAGWRSRQDLTDVDDEASDDKTKRAQLGIPKAARCAKSRIARPDLAALPPQDTLSPPHETAGSASTV
jgi:hypothetical protein